MIDTASDTGRDLRLLAEFLARLSGDECQAASPDINGPSPAIILAPEPLVAPTPPVNVEVMIDDLAAFRAMRAAQIASAVPAPPAGVALFNAPLPPPPVPPVPPPPPVATAPAAPNVGVPDAARSASIQTAGVAADFSQRDSANIPWDERIHSSAKSFKADGRWKYRRGLDDAIKTAVESELFAKYVVIPQPPVALPASVQQVPSPASVFVPPVPPPPYVTAQAQFNANVAVVPPPPSSVPLPPTGAVPVPPPPPMGLPNPQNAPVLPLSSFRDLLTKVAQNVAAGKLTQVQVEEACRAQGIQGGINGLASQPMLVPAVDAAINIILGV